MGWPLGSTISRTHPRMRTWMRNAIMRWMVPGSTGIGASQFPVAYAC